MGTPEQVVVHPLVLLSVVDHYNRVAKGTTKRVVGILLGSVVRGRVDVTNSYAVPFEEDAKDPSTWFLDHNYHEDMFAMFKKVNAKERVVGWYSTGPEIRPADLEINELMRRYTAHPVLTVIEVDPKDGLEIPTKAYISVEENLKHAKSTSDTRRTFVHVPTDVGAFEAEEVGVEHLLRDIRDTTTASVVDKVHAKFASLRGLQSRMETMTKYLDDVLAGRVPLDHRIIYNMQDIFNLSPNLNAEELVRAFQVKTNDNAHVIYLSSMVRSIIALDKLINNRIMNIENEAAAKKKAAEKKAKKEKAAADEAAAATAAAAKKKAEGKEADDEKKD